MTNQTLFKVQSDDTLQLNKQGRSSENNEKNNIKHKGCLKQ